MEIVEGLAKSQSAFVALLLAIIITGLRGDWLFKWVHVQIMALMEQRLSDALQRGDAMERERDFWRGLATRASTVSEKAVVVAEKAVEGPR